MSEQSPQQDNLNITWEHSDIPRQERWEILGLSGMTIWLTGLSGSGKSTIAFAFENNLISQRRAVCVLDGDNLRYGINEDLGFSASDRKENNRRTAEISLLMANAGLIVVVPQISPFRVSREHAREIHAKAGIPFYEVFVDTPIEVCESRDPKGLYKQARKGLIKGFTGIDDPYEAPENPDLVIRSEQGQLSGHVKELMKLIEEP
jgi:bifunctional enzyme CysN/CysC